MGLSFLGFYLFCWWPVSPLSLFLSFSYCLYIWHKGIRRSHGIRITLSIRYTQAEQTLCSYSSPNQRTCFKPTSFWKQRKYFQSPVKSIYSVICIIFVNKAESQSSSLTPLSFSSSSVEKSCQPSLTASISSPQPSPIRHYPISPLNFSYCSC